MRQVYRVFVEKDEVFSVQEGKPRYKVVIANIIEKEVLHTIGVPLRNVTYKDAAKARQGIQFAFDYGIREAKSYFEQSIWNTRFEVKE